MAGSSRYRYGPWNDGPDPLAPPYDLRAALDELGEDVLAGRSVREAIADLLRRGLDGRRGLDDLAARVRRMKKQARRRGDLGGTLDQVRAALDQALATERDALAADDGEDARWQEMELATLPDDVAGAVRGLREYDWASAEARETYEQITRMLTTQVLDAQFAGMAQALADPDPQAMAAVKDMLADLNALLAKHARGEDTHADFDDFMERHGELFPEQPETVDELIDALARRQAAADRLMSSLSSDQRDQLQQLMAEAMSDPDLASQMSQLGDNLRSLRPGLNRGPARGVGQGQGQGESLGYSDAVEALADLADLEALEQALEGQGPGEDPFGPPGGPGSLDDVDVEALERQLGAEAVRDLEALRRLEGELERQGYLSRGADGARLTPRAVRRLGQSALRTVFAQLEASGSGDHRDRRPGAADEATGTTRAWQFGDEQPIDTVRTVSNALLRGEGLPARLHVDDFEIRETERRTSAAVALCVDLSFSMVNEGRWGPMKQTALALSHLVSTQFRQDALQIIGFDRTARRLDAVQLAEVEPEWVQGTNLQHALMLARRHLRRHPDAEPVVLVVTDGEPTAHLTGDGHPFFMWPSTPETVRATVAQVDDVVRAGATLNFFMLGEDPGLRRFVDAMARRAGGRVLSPDVDRLGEYVVADYLRARRGRR
ncbi:hypothetical protein KLP28_14215 [Nocardioidaceae bacterium]|nr:hypothetical protein KLP28_14215 [Nocardioidaceae bacterium]